MHFSIDDPHPSLHRSAKGVSVSVAGALTAHAEDTEILPELRDFIFKQQISVNFEDRTDAQFSSWERIIRRAPTDPFHEEVIRHLREDEQPGLFGAHSGITYPRPRLWVTFFVSNSYLNWLVQAAQTIITSVKPYRISVSGVIFLGKHTSDFVPKFCNSEAFRSACLIDVSVAAGGVR